MNFLKIVYIFFMLQTAQAETITLNIDESTDVMSDRRQDGNKVSLDVTGYVVQYKLVDDDWDAAEEAAFDRSKQRPVLCARRTPLHSQPFANLIDVNVTLVLSTSGQNVKRPAHDLWCTFTLSRIIFNLKSLKLCQASKIRR